MNKTHTFAILGVIIAIIAVGAVFFIKNAPEPVFVVNPADNIVSWDFQGDHLGLETLEDKARDEISKENELLKNEAYTEYQVYTHVANQYHFLGDGENELKYLQKALRLDSDGTGLAWHNIGNLMVRLGALYSARDAYEKSYKVQPIAFYKDRYVEFMQENFPEELQRLIEEEQAAANSTTTPETEGLKVTI